MTDATPSTLALKPRHLQILIGVAVLLVVAEIVGIVRTGQALEDARAADWRAVQAESRAMNAENRVNALTHQVSTLTLRVNALPQH